jgi:hypothetical protein
MMKLGINLLKNKNRSLRVFAGGIFILVAFLFLNSKGQFGRFSFWGTRDGGDATAPTCSFTTQPTLNNGWLNGTTPATFVYSCTDNVTVTRVECNLNNNGWSSCDSDTTHTITGLTNTAANNSNVFKIRAFDSSGNVSTTVNSSNFGVDLNGPNAPTSLNETGTDTGTVSFTPSGAVDVGNSGIYTNYYSYDNGVPNYAWNMFGSFSNNLSGTVFLRVYYTDNAGNIGTPLVVSWTNGGWSAWSTSCTGACGDPGSVHTRTCDNPAPSTSPVGKPCSGSSTKNCGNTTDNATEMCAGSKYYVEYVTPSGECPPANPCPATLTSVNGSVNLCSHSMNADTTTNVCDSGNSFLPNGTTVSCVNGSATVVNPKPCYTTFKSNSYSTYECSCN